MKKEGIFHLARKKFEAKCKAITVLAVKADGWE
jgi:hypothetical protein